MNEEKIINNESTILTEEQVHHVYNELSGADKASADNLANAEKETAAADYKDVVTMGSILDSIPGVAVTPANVDNIQENEEDVKSALNDYDFDDQTMVDMLRVIDDYRAGKTSNIYSKLPESFKNAVDNMIAGIDGGNAKELKEAGAKTLVESFINDAKINATMDDFNAEMSTAINDMNKEYDDMISKAIDDTFSKIDEIKAEDPERAKVIESVKSSFEDAISFNAQLEFAKNTKVNNNTFGVKVPNIEEIVPVIKSALPNKYTGNDIRKFVICVCKTAKDPKDLAGTAYNYRLVSSIYRYKFTAIDEKGETIFENISKVIDEIIS